MLTTALEGVVDVDKFPKAVVDVAVLVLQVQCWLGLLVFVACAYHTGLGGSIWFHVHVQDAMVITEPLKNSNSTVTLLL